MFLKLVFPLKKQRVRYVKILNPLNERPLTKSLLS